MAASRAIHGDAVQAQPLPFPVAAKVERQPSAARGCRSTALWRSRPRVYGIRTAWPAPPTEEPRAAGYAPTTSTSTVALTSGCSRTAT